MLVTVSCNGQAASTEPPTPESKPTEIGKIIVTVKDVAQNNINNAEVNLATSSKKPPGIMDDNTYRLQACPEGDRITAWAPGYFINWVVCDPAKTDYTIQLQKYDVQDWINYKWRSAYTNNESGLSCGQCHENTGSSSYSGHPVYDEWRRNKHSQSAINPYFYSIYNGHWFNPGSTWLQRENEVNPSGNAYLQVVTPNVVVEPGYRLDYPQLNGNCAACHAPLAVTGEIIEVDMNTISQLALEGINCDFCHKILDVDISKNTNRPYTDRPGLLSYDFVRPLTPDAQVLVGPLKNAINHDATYSSTHSESEYCAPCHYGVFWDTIIYNSYGEWKASPYADTESNDYKTCQDCHMIDRRDADNLAPHPFYNHNMMIGEDERSLIKDAVTLEVGAKYNEKKDRIIVNVTLRNDKVGHKVPTDSPLRHLIVLVKVSDNAGMPLPQIAGDTVPDWVGTGDPGIGYYGGLPGTGFGYVLMDKTDNSVPAISYWNPTKIILDTRISPFDEEKSNHEFAAPDSGNAIVTVEVLYRYAFKDLMVRKGWYGSQIADIVISEMEKTVKIP